MMKNEARLKYLGYALYAIGAIFIVGIWTMMQIWPAGWGWEPRQPEYEQMIMGVYATLGVFLILAAKNPLEHLSLIRFTIWSSVVHAAIMAAQAFSDSQEHGHLVGDVPALLQGLVYAAPDDILGITWLHLWIALEDRIYETGR